MDIFEHLAKQCKMIDVLQPYFYLLQLIISLKIIFVKYISCLPFHTAIVGYVGPWADVLGIRFDVIVVEYVALKPTDKADLVDIDWCPTSAVVVFDIIVIGVESAGMLAIESQNNVVGNDRQPSMRNSIGGCGCAAKIGFFLEDQSRWRFGTCFSEWKKH